MIRLILSAMLLSHSCEDSCDRADWEVCLARPSEVPAVILPRITPIAVSTTACGFDLNADFG